MRKWLVDKLFSLALRIDETETTVLARLWVEADDASRIMDAIIKDMMESLEAGARAAPKRGRPKGRKDSVGPKHEPEVKRKRGRPLGSKNKPKEVN